MGATSLLFLASTLVVYFFIYNITTWGLNIQFGYAGVPNFTYITFVAAGAYFTGVLGLDPSKGTYAQYILGFGWPFPVTLLGGACAACALALLIGSVGLRRLRSDHLAIVIFCLGFVGFDIANTWVPLFNGTNGIAGVTPPFSAQLGLDPNSYTFFFIALSGVIMLVLWLVANRVYNSPLGRTLRAIREDAGAAETLGKNTFIFRLTALAIGCFYAGVAGGLTVEFVTAYNPSAFGSTETFAIWTAMLVGGRANNLGSVVGTFIVLVVLVEGSRFIPVPVDQTVLIQDLRYVLLGVMLIVILWFRSEGLLPEKRRVYELPVGSRWGRRWWVGHAVGDREVSEGAEGGGS